MNKRGGLSQIVRSQHCLLALAASLVSALLAPAPLHALEARVVIQGDQEQGKISRHIYGHFAEHLGRCIYDGIWVGEDSPLRNTNGMRQDIIDALKAINIPNLRWPGGCFADDYHWRDGIGPKDQRPRRINIHWGQVIDTNAFGTHEFLELCEILGAEPYIAGNVGSGTAQEMRDWIEYMTFAGDSELAELRRANGREEPWKIKYFGVGNENWGCGGNMTPEYYADLFRRFATYCKDYSGNRLQRIACGPGGLGNNKWTEVMMPKVANRMQGYSLHYYTVPTPWDQKFQAVGFGEEQWFRILRESLRIEELLSETERIMSEADLSKPVPLYVDEWGTWYSPEPGTNPSFLYQQNTLCDALVAGLTLHVFHEHNDTVHMANIAQTVNVLQAMILTEGEKMLLTPTYHVFDMYQVHQDATRLPIELTTPDYKFQDRSMPALSVSASKNQSGEVHISIVNAHATESIDLSCELSGVSGRKVSGRILTAEKLDAHNTFDSPTNVQTADFSAAELTGQSLSARIPARSVVVLQLASQQ